MTRSRIGPLALEAPLGARGSNVFRAVHVQQRAQVAVRVFSVPMGMTPESKQEFANQLEVLKTIRHPGIVRCFGGGFDAKDAYLVYELFDSDSLEQLIRRKQRLPWESVLDYGLQLCDALQLAHSMGWIHGNIRPDKILVSKDGLTVKLNDLRRGPGPLRPLNAEQLAFCAPETFADQPVTEASADLYSLGAILYFALTGRPPYSGANPTLVKQAITETVAESVASLVFECPVWLSAIVDQLLDKDPRRRPYTAVAAAMALREAQKREVEGIGVAQHAMSGFSPLQLDINRDEAAKALGIKKKKKRKRDDEIDDAPSLLERPLVLLGLLVCAVGLIAFLVWPANERTLRDRAERLLKKEDSVSWNDARDRYLYPMLERFPNGQYADWAQEQLDIVEMRNAEERMKRNLRIGREPASEGERKYAEAVRFERFGDRVTALDKYKGIVKLLKDEKKERPFVNLARRQIELIESNPPSVEELRRFLKEKLTEADKLYSDGDITGARQIWEGIISLYNGNQEMLPIVEQAQGRMERLKNS